MSESELGSVAFFNRPLHAAYEFDILMMRQHVLRHFQYERDRLALRTFDLCAKVALTIQLWGGAF